MMYTLGGTDLSVFDFTPIITGDTDVSLSGFLDMPARLGKTFHDWAGVDGIQPYVSASEIFFGGRDLLLDGVIMGSEQYDCNSKITAMVALLDSFTGLVPLVCEWGTFQVYINKAITGEYAGRTSTDGAGIKISIPMREPVVPMTGTAPTGDSSEFGIDGVSFASLGGAYLELSGDRWGRTEPKKSNVTAYGKEGYSITKKSAPTLSLKLAIKTNTYAELKTKVNSLMKLLSAPGMRYLTVNNDKLRSVFVKDGFKVSKIHVQTEECFCVIDCELTESGVAGTFADLADSLGELITDSDSNQIRIMI